MDWKNIYSDATIAINIILNKGFITGLYSAVATYVLFILRDIKANDDNNLTGKIISKKVFRIAGIVLLFLTGALEINYQCKHSFPSI